MRVAPVNYGAGLVSFAPPIASFPSYTYGSRAGCVRAAPARTVYGVAGQHQAPRDREFASREGSKSPHFALSPERRSDSLPIVQFSPGTKPWPGDPPPHVFKVGGQSANAALPVSLTPFDPMTFTIDKKFSEAISNPLIKAYQKGGLGLAFLVLGAILLLASAFLDRSNPLLWILAVIGFLLILAVVALFYFQAIRPIQNAQTTVSANADVIDAVQMAAMRMTEVAYLLQSTAFKHAETIRQIIAIATVKVRDIPVVGPPTSLVLQRVLEKYSPSVAS